MATTLIHLAIAKEINKKINKEEKSLLLGTIAPDISALLGETKEISHFLDPSQEYEIPNCNKFLEKYQSNLENPFVLGYYIHLLTDKYWLEDYISKKVESYTHNTYKKSMTYAALRNMMYNDYTDLNKKIIETYSLSTKDLVLEKPIPTNWVKEMNTKNIDKVLEKVQDIINTSQEEKLFSIDWIEIQEQIENIIEKIEKDILKIL